jgi:hypothetical protein
MKLRSWKDYEQPREVTVYDTDSETDPGRRGKYIAIEFKPAGRLVMLTKAHAMQMAKHLLKLAEKK